MPVPMPDLVSATKRVLTMALVKLAVTLRAALMVTVQVLAVPVHAPLQPVNVLVLAGVAVKVTLVPLA